LFKGNEGPPGPQGSSGSPGEKGDQGLIGKYKNKNYYLNWPLEYKIKIDVKYFVLFI